MILGSARLSIFSTQIPRDQPKLLQRRLQVLNDFLGDDIRRREVVGISQAFVLQPEDVQAGLVTVVRLVAGDELVEILTPERGGLEREVLVGAQVVELLDVVAIAHPVVAQDVAVAPEFLDDGRGIHGWSVG